MTLGDCGGEVLVWSCEVGGILSWLGGWVGVGSGLEVLRFCAFDFGTGVWGSEGRRRRQLRATQQSDVVIWRKDLPLLSSREEDLVMLVIRGSCGWRMELRAGREERTRQTDRRDPTQQSR